MKVLFFIGASFVMAAFIAWLEQTYHLYRSNYDKANKAFFRVVLFSSVGLPFVLFYALTL